MIKNEKRKHINPVVYVCYALLVCVFRAVLCVYLFKPFSYGFLNVLQHFCFEHIFNLYFITLYYFVQIS